MKYLKTTFLAAATIGLAGLGITANSADCVTCGGWFYTAQKYLGPGDYNYSYRGPFSTEEECNQARNADFGDGDSWLPSESHGNGCSFRFESDYGAYNEILDHYNLATPGGNSGGAGHGDIVGRLISDEELIHDISTLRGVFQVDAYESKLDSMITDPGNDGDYDKEDPNAGTKTK